jgi:hypothetical protein
MHAQPPCQCVILPAARAFREAAATRPRLSGRRAVWQSAGLAPKLAVSRTVTTMEGQLTRRSLLWGTGLIGLVAASDALPRIGGELPRRAPDLGVPANNLRALVRMTASLEERDVPWWYDGTIYGIVAGENPRPLVRFEGMELYWLRHLPDGEYELVGNTVTFFRDLETGRMLERFANPYTGRENQVPAAVQGGGPGRGFNYSVKGIRPTKFIGQMPEKPPVLDWSFARDQVWLHNTTAYPPGLPPPRMQRQTMFAAQRDFLDERLASIPALFSSTVFMPWLKWMEMGDAAGHVVWHASGAKLASIAELPAEYRRRAEQEYPQLMSADPSKPRDVPAGH